MERPKTRRGARKGPLKPAANAGEVVVDDPPNDPLLMTPDEADVSGLRLLDAAEKARQALRDPGVLKD